MDYKCYHEITSRVESSVDLGRDFQAHLNWKNKWILSLAGISKHTWKLENSVDLGSFFQAHLETDKLCGSWSAGFSYAR